MMDLGHLGIGGFSNPFLGSITGGADLGGGSSFAGMASSLMSGPLGGFTNPAGAMMGGAPSFGEILGTGGGPALGSFLGSNPLSFSPSFDSIASGNNIVAPTPSVLSALSGQEPTTGKSATGGQASAQAILEKVKSGQISLLGQQVSGVKDTASAAHSIAQAAAGKSADTSKYGHAKGKQVELSPKMLEGMNKLAEKYKFNVSSVAGGKHGKNSRHYAGTAFDVNSINGKKVDKNNPDYKAFMRDAKKLGATEVIGPGSKGHSGHVHVGFPRGDEDGRAKPTRPKGTKSSKKPKKSNRKRPKAASKPRKTGSKKIKKPSPKNIKRNTTRRV